MVQLTEVAKYYGAKRALGPVTFEIAKGDTVGFLGLNGVGKTTLLRILACGLRPSAGSVLIDGVDALEEPHLVRKRVGYLPERPPLYGEMTVGDYLRFVGRIKGLEAGELERRVPEVEEYARLTEVDREPTGHLSQGYKQRVGVAQAIIHDPDLLILDEPTHDLDPVQIMEMRTMIQNLKDSHTILISSHILPEISQTCDRLLILDAGRIVASGTEEELTSKLLGNHRLTVTIRSKDGESGDAVGLSAVVGAVPGVVDVEVVAGERDAVALQVDGSSDLRSEVCRALVEAGHEVIGLERTERKLESVFVGLVGVGEA